MEGDLHKRMWKIAEENKEGYSKYTKRYLQNEHWVTAWRTPAVNWLPAIADGRFPELDWTAEHTLYDAHLRHVCT